MYKTSKLQITQKFNYNPVCVPKFNITSTFISQLSCWSYSYVPKPNWLQSGRSDWKQHKTVWKIEYNDKIECNVKPDNVMQQIKNIINNW